MVWLPYYYIVNIVHVSMLLIVVCYHVLCQMRNKKLQKKKFPIGGHSVTLT